MRFIISIVLLVAACARCPGATLTVSPSTQSLNVGSVYSLAITVSGVSDLYAYQFDLQYDPAVVSIETLTPGDFFPTDGSAFFVPGVVDPPGTLGGTAQTLLGPVAGITGNGVLARIEVRAVAPGESVLSLANIILLDSALFPIDVSAESGTVGVTVLPEPGTLAISVVPLALFLICLLGQHRQSKGQVKSLLARSFRQRESID